MSGSPAFGSGSPSVPRASKEQVAVKVLERLKESWPAIAEDRELEEELKGHLMRLPRRYALDIHNLEDLRTHMRLLHAAKNGSSRGSVICDSRGIRVSSVFGDGAGRGEGGESSGDVDMAGAASPVNIARKLRAPTFGSSFNLHTLEEPGGPIGSVNADGSTRQRLAVYEIAVSGLNRPRMLSRVSTALFDIGLNITEAHVFCTDDGFALDVFVVQGWKPDDAASLNVHLQKRLGQVNW